MQYRPINGHAKIIQRLCCAGHVCDLCLDGRATRNLIIVAAAVWRRRMYIHSLSLSLRVEIRANFQASAFKCLPFGFGALYPSRMHRECGKFRDDALANRVIRWNAVLSAWRLLYIGSRFTSCRFLRFIGRRSLRDFREMGWFCSL